MKRLQFLGALLVGMIAAPAKRKMIEAWAINKDLGPDPDRPGYRIVDTKVLFYRFDDGSVEVHTLPLSKADEQLIASYV